MNPERDQEHYYKYVTHCQRYIPELEKINIPYLSESFVALECDIGPWAGFMYYGLITDAHYKVLAGPQAAGKKRIQKVIDAWKDIGIPTLTTPGSKRFKYRRWLIHNCIDPTGD